MPLFLNFVSMYKKQIAYAAIIAIIFMFGWYKGYSYEKRAYDAYKLDIETKSKAQEIKNAETAKKQQEITDNLAKGYADAVKKLNDYYGSHPNIKWMQQRCDSQAMSKVPNSTSSVDGKAKGYQVDTTGVDPLDCASDVLQLLHLQKWIRDQELVQ